MTMWVTKRVRFGVGASLAMAALLAGCGGGSTDDPGQTGTPKVTTTVVEETTTLPPATAAQASSTGDAANLTGAARADGAATEENTVTVSEDGFSPSSLTVDPGELVTFMSGDLTAYEVVVGGLPAVTVTATLVESFDFASGGTVEVTLDGDADMSMSITVSGPLATQPTSDDTAPEVESAPTTNVTDTSSPAQTTTTEQLDPSGTTIP